MGAPSHFTEPTMAKTLLLAGAAALVAAPLLLAASQPDSFRVERRTVVEAPPARVHALINDLRQFNTWNPYERKDPALRGEYRGPQAGAGAQYHFAGNRDVGRGSLTIVSVTPTAVTMDLHMAEPFESRNTVEFVLTPRGGATEVTWAMHGPAHFAGKLLGLFIDMDGMIGRDFEAGLAGLKARAERSAG